MFRRISSAVVKDLKRVFTPGTIACIVIGTAIASFGLHNVHQRTGITEGGVLGMILLLNHWFHIPAAIASPALDLCCYLLAFRMLGKDFLKTSAFASVCLAGWFFLWERLPYLFPDLSGSPLLAAIAGALFIGVGVGLVVLRRRRCACHGHIQGAEVPDRGGVSLYRCDGPSLIAYVPAGPQDRIFPDHRDPVVYAS